MVDNQYIILKENEKQYQKEMEFQEHPIHIIILYYRFIFVISSSILFFNKTCFDKVLIYFLNF